MVRLLVLLSGFLLGTFGFMDDFPMLNNNNWSTGEFGGNIDDYFDYEYYDDYDDEPVYSSRNRNNCTCVPFHHCRDSLIETRGMLNVIDISLKDGPCISYLEECCRSGAVGDESVVPIKANGKRSGQCGYANPQGIGFRISGGKDNEVQFGEYPWMIALLAEKDDQGQHSVKERKLHRFLCGASLIHPQVVLTAAHCVASFREAVLKVRAGEWDTQTTNEIEPHQDVYVEDIIMHPKFNERNLRYDIALLKMEQPVEITDNVNTVCLPPFGTTFDNSRCFASGWGKDQFGRKGHHQVILKKVPLPVVPFEECEERLQQTRLGEFFELHDSFICAGGEEGIDMCKGDGGGPLVCPIEGERDRYYQAGIVSWGIGCNDAIPGVYVNVAEFRDWIDKQMNSWQLDIEYNP